LCLYRVVFSIPAKESRPASVELTSRCWRSAMSCASLPAINEKPSSPSPEKTTARQDQTRQSSTGDGAWDGRDWSEEAVYAHICGSHCQSIECSQD
jgi:hypothetical protein